MAELDDLSITDASNTARFPENMQFRNVNDGARALEGMLAREYRDRNMSLAASGSSNAFSVTPNRALTGLSDGLLIGFTANHPITGAATINVGGLGIRPIVSSNGSALVAGDIVSGQKLQIVYRAASNDWQIVGQRTTGSNADITARVTPVGTIIPYGGSTLPAGYLWAAGGTASRTAYAELFAVYGTTYGAGDGSTTFGLPDWRGRTPFGKDDMGGTAANRLTSTFGIDGATLGATGGAQSTTLITANLPAHNHTATVTDPGHAHEQTVTSDGGFTGPATGGGYTAYAFDGEQNTASATTGISVSIGNTGSGSAFSNIPPGAVSNWIILAIPAAASASTLGVNGHLYRWSTTTTDTDPGSGKLGFDNATLSSATTLFISETDAASGPMANVLALWDDSTSTTKGTLYVYKVGQLSTYCVFTVSGTITDAGAYAKFTVAHAASNGTFAADDQLSVLFVPKGDVGDPGAGLNWRSSWLTATSYAVADGVKNGGASYICTVAHTSGASTEPGVGASWTTVWDPIAEKGAAGSGSGDMVAANNLSDLANAATAFANIKQAATETATGVVELATTAEATTGTDTVRAVTPAGLKAHVDARNGTTASSAITDNRVARGDGGARGLQESPVGIDDSGNVSGVVALSTTTIELGHATDTTLARVSAGVVSVEGETVHTNSISRTVTASGIELGHATDTTITRTSAGAIAVEGVDVALNSSSLPHTAGTIELGHASDTTFARVSAGIASIEGSVIQLAGVQEWFIPAASFAPRTTGGCATLATLETTTNRVNLPHLAFDATTQEFAQVQIPRMPKSWNEGTITAIPQWTHPSTTTNFGVVWGVSAVALSDGDAGDTAFGTAQTATDTGGTTSTIYHGPATSAITIGNSPAEGDTVVIQVSRNPADASDTMAVDAFFLGLLIRVTSNAANDA